MAGPSAADPFNLHSLPLQSDGVVDLDSAHASGQPSSGVVSTTGGFQAPGGSDTGSGLNGPSGLGWGELAHNHVLAPNSRVNVTGVRLFDSGDNPVVAAKLQLNGHDRFSEREGRYFNLVQPYQHHENVPATGINVYSFGLKPEEHQPSGTCNMSRIDNATLHLTLTKAAVHGNRSCKAVSYTHLTLPTNREV